MSVLVKDRKESKFEAITFSIEIHDINKNITIINKKLIISDK